LLELMLMLREMEISAREWNSVLGGMVHYFPTSQFLGVVELLEEERPYLQSRLTLQELASKLDLPAYQLSQLINREFGQNFFELINHYRVEEVKKKLADPAFQHLTYLGIALESGFNSKASFNRIFKKMTGKTPNEYRKSSGLSVH